MADRNVPGSPSASTPPLSEPTGPGTLLPPKPDQHGPEPRTPTGTELLVDEETHGQQGRRLTTSTGTRLADTDHSLKAGPRGPALLADHHLREKITHFDHERIPERVVHARGAAAHGSFVANGAAEKVCGAAFLKAGVETPVFTRFSTVLGSRGSADAVRDTRGFATKFYTEEGIYDLVGNNMPVFFIQDGIKFPDIVHAAKPHPDREIPQAQSAHDTFWDFVSLHTEAQHHTLWNMSDRGIPRSLRMMEGFGVHTFRLTNSDGATTLAKFHWKPRQGVHGLTWEEAQLINGLDPDFHRRDLADAIEAGHFPQWDLGFQVMPDTAEEMFEGVDLLDPTKFVPEELCPVRIVGTLTLNANPLNYFAETEQVAFHVGNLVPGIDVTNDPLLQVRLFSYLDTQLSRLGGPNFNQLPINRPHAPVNDMLRDGMHQSAIHSGVAPYRPNSLDGGCPMHAAEGAFIDVPQPLNAELRVRENPATFSDHYSQATLFFRSLTAVEKDHVIGAYTFELGRCFEEPIRKRQLACLARIEPTLAEAVAAGLGLSVPEGAEPPPAIEPSAALSMLGGTWPVAGRVVGLIVGDPAPTLDEIIDALDELGILAVVIAPTGGPFQSVPTQRTYATANSAELDAVIVAAPAPPGADARPTLDAKASGVPDDGTDPRIVKLLQEAWRHSKALGALQEAESVLTAAGVVPGSEGVVLGAPGTVVDEVALHLSRHRVWQRFEPVSKQ